MIASYFVTVVWATCTLNSKSVQNETIIHFATNYMLLFYHKIILFVVCVCVCVTVM